MKRTLYACFVAVIFLSVLAIFSLSNAQIRRPPVSTNTRPPALVYGMQAENVQYQRLGDDVQCHFLIKNTGSVLPVGTRISVSVKDITTQNEPERIFSVTGTEMAVTNRGETRAMNIQWPSRFGATYRICMWPSASIIADSASAEFCWNVSDGSIQ